MSQPSFSKMRVCRRCQFNGWATPSPTGSLRPALRTDVRSTTRLIYKLTAARSQRRRSSLQILPDKNKPVTDHHGHSTRPRYNNWAKQSPFQTGAGGAGERAQTEAGGHQSAQNRGATDLSPKMANSRLSHSRTANPPSQPSRLRLFFLLTSLESTTNKRQRDPTHPPRAE